MMRRFPCAGVLCGMTGTAFFPPQASVILAAAGSGLSAGWSLVIMNAQQFDTAIIGGGLAGLALSIQLARLGHAVVLLEKEAYPYHKVCGEYISNESWPFLLR